MIRIECPDGSAGFRDFLAVHDAAYEYRSAAHGEFAPLTMPILEGRSPFLRDRRARAFLAREGSRCVARVLAVRDGRYEARWREKLGHLVFFEALPDAEEAVRRMLDEACAWLRSRGRLSVRAGFGMLEMPFPIDEYERLPPLGVRQSPPWYHGYFKNAGFFTEKGWVDYRIAVTPGLRGRYEALVEQARRRGYDLVPLAALPEREIRARFVRPYNHFFRDHWGYSPFYEDDMSELLEMQAALDTRRLSVIALDRRETVGAVWGTGDPSAFARLHPGRILGPEERVNFLGIGVASGHRGRGVNLALAASCYLELIRRGAKHLSYTMVLDDNWPSRRTAEKLGARVCASYLVYRRELDRRPAGGATSDRPNGQGPRRTTPGA